MCCVHVFVTKCACTAYVANHSDPVDVPTLTVSIVGRIVEYQVQKSDNATERVITGYEVFRFGVPMIGEYVNTGRGRRVTISPAVPGAQYRITAWALDRTRRSVTPAEEGATTEEKCKLYIFTTKSYINSML